MRILRVLDGPETERHFLIDTRRDLENVALKLLNERRIEQRDQGDTAAFIAHITDEQDGDLAISMVQRLYQTKIISPEVV